jgi:tetratricopeptide (TPR) repeat protein
MGRLDEADDLYRGALMRLDAIGDGHRVFVETNLGLLLMERGRFGEALPALRSVLDRFERQGRAQMRGITHVFVLPCLAWAGEWQEFDDHLSRAERLLARTGYADHDAARMAWSAARAARATGHDELARRCFALARDQFRGLKHDAEAEAVERESIGPRDA